MIDYFWEKEWIKRPKSALFSKQVLKLSVMMSSKSKLLYIVTVIFLFLIKPRNYGFRANKSLILKVLKFVKYCGKNVPSVKSLFLWSNSLVSGSGNLRPEICEIITGSFQAKTTTWYAVHWLFVCVWCIAKIQTC